VLGKAIGSESFTGIGSFSALLCMSPYCSSKAPHLELYPGTYFGSVFSRAQLVSMNIMRDINV
jgi:hypothetical protein